MNVYDNEGDVEIFAEITDANHEDNEEGIPLLYLNIHRTEHNSQEYVDLDKNDLESLIKALQNIYDKMDY